MRILYFFFFSSRRRHTRLQGDWSSDVCSSDLKSLVHEPNFADRIVLALDARDGIVTTRGWTATSDKRAVDIAEQVRDWPLAAILYTDVARDGMMGGPNFEQTRAIVNAGKVPVIASGGVGTIQHVTQLPQ